MRLLRAVVAGTSLFTLINTHSVLAACSITVTNTNNSGAGSLRQAMIDANQNSNADEICFSIGSGQQTISPTSPLPPVINVLYINGTSQSGYSNVPLIRINGSGAGGGAYGLHFAGNGNGSTVRGLAINNFSADGIWINTSNITVVGNYIGVGLSGNTDEGNGHAGIGIFSGDPSSTSIADSNIIGGTVDTDRNIVSGNGANGIVINAQAGGRSSSNTIQGNYIGTNATGTSAIPNVGDGILINHASGSATMSSNIIGGSTSTTPGGACTGSCNLVSGNDANGIGLWHSAVTNTLVTGNYVGTNANGTSPIRNGNIGIEVNESPNNTVGGTTPAERNVFSGNGGAGVFLTGASSTGNTIRGNFIGTNSAGTSGVGNLKMGVGIGFSPGAIGANSNTIGGVASTTPGTACAGSCNLISGNGENGILILGAESQGHLIIGNYIGLNLSGTVAIGNVGDGIGLLNTPNTSIGNGSDAGRNIIGSNGSNGIIVAGASSTGNRIDRNTVGLTGFGNTMSGIAISSATDTAVLSNSINFNGLQGIDLDYNGTVNKNDVADNDTGANRLQNYPEIFASSTINGVTRIGGQFAGAPSGSFLLEFFGSDGCNAGYPNNYGEGQDFLGSININTDIFGNTAYSFYPSSPVAGNRYITATATKKINGIPAETSEFSRCALINTSKPMLTNGASWLLKHDLTSGAADIVFGYGFPSTFLMCAWDANQIGVKLPVIVSSGSWFMRASYTTGTADLTMQYSVPGATPICGDWDGDGIDTPGMVTPDKVWHLRNSNSTGAADIVFQYGPTNSVPTPGDWDGNGTDTPGVATPEQTFYLRNSNTSGAPDAGTVTFGYIPGYPIVGDWDGNGYDTIGSVASDGTWALRNSLSGGPANGTFQFSYPGAVPLTLH